MIKGPIKITTGRGPILSPNISSTEHHYGRLFWGVDFPVSIRRIHTAYI